jgi:TatD DNase family protein
VLEDLKRASARTQVALGAELPAQLHEPVKVDRLWPIEMDESHDIVDIGVNLTHRSFQRDREEVIQRAFAAGVRTMVITGTSLVSSEAALRIARESTHQLFATAGVHPHDTRNCTAQTILELRRLAANKEVVAIGECGLDFNRDFSPRPQQEKWFEAQIALAEELQMPLFLHERDAQQRFCEILKRTRKSVPAVIHCFTGTREELKAYLDMGLYFGITGWICDERRGMHLREFVKEIPADRLMIETDAPFLLPRNMLTKPKDGRNEPAFLTFVLKTMADCLGKPVALVAQETTNTATAFFRIGHPL